MQGYPFYNNVVTNKDSIVLKSNMYIYIYQKNKILTVKGDALQTKFLASK